MGRPAEVQQQAKRKRSVPGYKILERLGAGGQASVYKAVQLSMNRPVALKVIPPEKAAADTDLSRFLREARVLARLRHENIVQAIDYGEVDGLRYLVMELVQGDSVLDLIRREKRIEPRRAIEIVLQVCRALGHAAKLGVIHRDIKPSNIVITNESRAVLVDFGLARREQSDAMVTIAGTTVGTPHYMSPEMIRCESDIDIRSDLYGLGATFYHMITGRVPFPSRSQAEILASHLKDPVPLPDTAPDGVPEDLFEIVRRAMEKERESRYQTSEEMVADLIAAVERIAGTGGSDTGGEMLEIPPQSAASVATGLRERIDRLTEERARLADENQGLSAKLKAARDRLDDLTRRTVEEVEEANRRRQESEERRASLEVDLRAAVSRMEVFQKEAARRETARGEAAAALCAMEAERDALEEKLRDVEATAARSAAEVASRRRAAEAEQREAREQLIERLAEADRRAEEIAASVAGAGAERDRILAENGRLRARIGEMEAEAGRRAVREEQEAAERAREESALCEKITTIEEALRDAQAAERRALRECRLASSQRDAHVERLGNLEADLAEAESALSGFESLRTAEVEALTREVEALRARLSEPVEALARAEAELTLARVEAERGHGENEALRLRAREEREALELRLQELAGQHRDSEREAARERRRLQEMLDEVTARADTLEQAAADRAEAVEQAETRARNGYDELEGELERARERTTVLETRWEELRRSVAEERHQWEREKEEVVRAREQAEVESLTAGARARELEREAARLTEEVARLREEAVQVAELSARSEVVSGERDALSRKLEEAQAASGRRAAEAAREIRAVRDEGRRLEEKIARLEEVDATASDDTEVGELRDRLQAVTAEKERLAERVHRIEARGVRAREDRESALTEVSRLREELEAEIRARQALDDGKSELLAEIRRLEAERAEMDRRMSSLRSELDELRHVADDEELGASLEKIVADRDRLAAELDTAREDLSESLARVTGERDALNEAVQRADLEQEKMAARASVLEQELEVERADRAGERSERERELARLANEREQLAERCEALRGELADVQAVREERGRLERRLRSREEALGRKDAELRAATQAGHDLTERIRKERDEAIEERDRLSARVEEIRSGLRDSEDRLEELARAAGERERLARKVEELERELAAGRDELERTAGRLEATEERLRVALAAEAEMRDQDLPHAATDEAERVAAYSLRRVEEMKERVAGVETERGVERDRAARKIEHLEADLERARSELERLARERSEVEAHSEELSRKLSHREEEWGRAKAVLEGTLAALRRELDEVAGELRVLSESRARDRARAAAYLRRVRGRVKELLVEAERLRRENRALRRDRDDVAAVLVTREDDLPRKPEADEMKTVDLEEATAEVQAMAMAAAGSREHDDTRMVLVPKGVFIAGEDEGAETETPRREVSLPGFWIDVHPVTNRQYRRFVEATKRPVPQHWEDGKIPDGLEEHPVVWVTWKDAVAYAVWCDKRLPVLHEWQKAGRGTDGRAFPWGDEAEVERCNCRETGFLRTTPVKQFRTGASSYGVTDLAGNVAEWVAGCFSAVGKGNARESRAVCGGSYRDPLERSRCASRHGYPDGSSSAYVGFRCVRDKS
ncbi:MAG: SUMF1/EgtB/PvdO family nonheme iron enzyme [Planctomycetota bacterium]